MNKREVIENFIHQFNAFGDDVRRCFSYGMCYHFALILHIRFRDEDAHKLYDPINGHFAVQINGRIYDITGDITDETIYTWVPWKNLYLPIAFAEIAYGKFPAKRCYVNSALTPLTMIGVTKSAI